MRNVKRLPGGLQGFTDTVIEPFEMRQGPPGTQLSAQFHSVPIRQAEIDQRQIRARLGRQGVVGRGDGDNDEATLPSSAIKYFSIAGSVAVPADRRRLKKGS